MTDATHRPAHGGYPDAALSDPVAGEKWEGPPYEYGVTWGPMSDPIAEENGREGETAWLIELAGSEPCAPRYWGGVHGWTDDHLKAIRFCREKDAQLQAETMSEGDFGLYRLAEHMWPIFTPPTVHPRTGEGRGMSARPRWLRRLIAWLTRPPYCPHQQEGECEACWLERQI